MGGQVPKPWEAVTEKERVEGPDEEFGAQDIAEAENAAQDEFKRLVERLKEAVKKSE